MRSAAKLAGISVTRWRQIVLGVQPAGGGNYVPVIGPADTVARMAQVVGVTPNELTAAGRPDAGARLGLMLSMGEQPTRTDPLGLDAQRRRINASTSLSRDDKARLLERLEQIEGTVHLAREAAAEVEDEISGAS